MLLLNKQEVIFDTFPNGETHLKSQEVLSKINNNQLQEVSFKYTDDSDLIKLMILKRYLDDNKIKSNLTIYYMPYSRMDRSENNSVFTLKYISEFINNLSFESMNVIEPHSDVTNALLHNSKSKLVTKELLPYVLGEIRFRKDTDYLFFPDEGVAKRYSNLKGYKYLIGHKNRDFETGEIKNLQVVGDVPSNPNRILIIDDLSSYGGTFFFSGKLLKDLGFKEVNLLIGHCEDSIFEGKLLKDDSPIDKIFTTDSIKTQNSPKIKTYRIEDIL